MMVLWGRELLSSHRLSIQTTLVSGTVSLQFVMRFDWGCQPPVWGEGVVVWGRRCVP